MSAHLEGIKQLGRPKDDGSKPTWNAALVAVPLNQGVRFQQEIIDHQLRSERTVAEYMKTRVRK